MSLGTKREPADALTFRRRWTTPITVSLALVAATTIALWLVQPKVNQQHLVFIYLVPISLVAIRYGSLSAMCITIVSSFVAAYYLYQPRFSLMIAEPLDILELTLFCVLALLASQVVSGFARDRDVEKRRPHASAPRLIERWPALAALWSRGGLH